MSFRDSDKPGIIAKYRLNDKDVGSPEVQIALLTARIDTQTKHSNKNAKDSSGRLGMFRLVGKRRRLLNYLNKESHDRYRKIIDALGIRK